MRKYVLMLVALLCLATLAVGAVQLTVSGIGVGYGPDRASADQDADQSAQSNMQNSCVGVVISSRNTGDSCTSNIGDDTNPKYMCTVGYVGTCQVGR